MLDQSVAESLHLFLSQWLIAHILGLEKRLGAFYRGDAGGATGEAQDLRL